MTHEVIFSPEAEAELLKLYDDLAEPAGPDVAFRYTERLRAYCLSFATFPERGTRRDDLRPGLRVTGIGDASPSLFMSPPTPSSSTGCSMPAAISKPCLARMTMHNALASAAENLPQLPAGAVVPAIVAAQGDRAAWRHLEFFAVSIRNPNTRAAYARAVSAFFAWCEALGWRYPASCRCMSPLGSSSWGGKGGQLPQ